MREKDYKYEYPIKALLFNEFQIKVRKMMAEEMPDDGITYYCDEDGTIYAEGEENFDLSKKEDCTHKWEVTKTDTKQFNYCSVCKRCDVIIK